MSIVFLHGFLGHPSDWDGVRGQLGQESLALTLPGHLEEPMGRDVVADVHERLGSARLLIGYSAGGRLALSLKARYPESYGRVIAFSAHPGMQEGREERRVKDDYWIEKLRSGPLEAFLEEWYAQPLFEGFDVPWERRLCHDPEMMALFLERFSPAVLPAPKLYPGTLFVYGERDLKYKTLFRTLPGHVDVIAVASAGHAVHLENPGRCAQLIGAAYDHHPTFEGERNALARDS